MSSTAVACDSERRLRSVGSSCQRIVGGTGPILWPVEHSKVGVHSDSARSTISSLPTAAAHVCLSNSRLLRSVTLGVSGLLLGIACFGLTGCDSSGTRNETRSGFTLDGMKQQQVVGRQSDHLARAMNLIRSEDVAEWDVFEDSVTDALNTAWNVAKTAESWQSMSAAQPGWVRSPLLDTLPAGYQDNLWFRGVDQQTYLYTDAHYLLEQFWLSELVKRISAESSGSRFAYLTHVGRPQPVTLDAALAEMDSELSSAAAAKLSVACKLFDWSVRNVTGDAFLELPPADTAADVALKPFNPDLPWSLSGIRGPGYRNYLWQTLSYGRGDCWEQGHVFLQLARHAGLDVAVLASPQLDNSKVLPKISHPELTPWSIAVLIDGKIFLFDPRLGLPLHDPDSLAILTLRAVKDRPELLSGQGLTAEESTELESVYPVTSQHLESLVALLDFPLEAFSLRTMFLQQNLTGSDRLDIYFPPDESAALFASHPLITGVELWALPLETLLFRDVVREASLRAARDRFLQSKLAWRSREETYFDGFPLLRRSRVLYLLGRFQPDPAGIQADCLQEFQKMRYTDEDWKNIADDPDLQKALGLYRSSGQSVIEFNMAMESQKAAMLIVRADAQFYLAQAHNESFNHGTSLNWLKLVDDFDEDQKWTRHTIYLQGRGLEAQRQYQAAVDSFRSLSELFRSQRSPRDYGAILRARLIEQRLAASTQP
jgi:hypothetical protein